MQAGALQSLLVLMSMGRLNPSTSETSYCKGVSDDQWTENALYTQSVPAASMLNSARVAGGFPVAVQVTPVPGHPPVLQARTVLGYERAQDVSYDSGSD